MAGRYINRKHECDYCGELALAPLPDDVPKTWHDGQPIKATRNKTRGIVCAMCHWTNFEEFCGSQGVSPYNPVKYYP